MRIIGLYISLTLLLLCSCKGHQQITNFDPEALCATVSEIDSINNVYAEQIAGWETTKPVSEQSIRDIMEMTANTWNQFVEYIRKQQFKKAAQFIQEPINHQSLIVHLCDFELRTKFIIDVESCLLLEYQEDNYYSTYADWLFHEVQTEMEYNGILYGQPHNVTETFPKLVLSYGNVLASAGRLELALELVPIYNLANEYFYPDDELWTKYEKAFFENTIYHLAGDAATADSILLDFRDNVTPEYGARGKDAAKDVDEIIAYWKEKERGLIEGITNNINSVRH